MVLEVCCYPDSLPFSTALKRLLEEDPLTGERCLQYARIFNIEEESTSPELHECLFRIGRRAATLTELLLWVRRSPLFALVEEQGITTIFPVDRDLPDSSGLHWYPLITSNHLTAVAFSPKHVSLWGAPTWQPGTQLLTFPDETVSQECAVAAECGRSNWLTALPT